MSSWRTRPVHIQWVGPSGSKVVLTEDGISLQAPSSLEQAEVEELLEIVAAARKAQMEERVQIPAAPDHETIRAMHRADHIDHTAKQVANFIRGGYREPTPNKAVEVPF